MKKSFWLLLLFLLPLTMQAQTKIGFFSHDAVLRAMPGYAEAQSSLDKLRSQYDAETQRVEDEFNRKYEEFLEGQRDFAPTILQKRQTELQELMAKNIQFRQEAERLLKQAERDALVPLNNKISEAVKALGKERGMMLILNTDGDALQYVDAEMGEDVTNDILSRLR
jgi:outer membrane protein